MLFDLTSVSGQRVSQVDELHLGGRQWVSSTNLFIAVAGAALATLVRVLPAAAGQWWPYLLIPAGMVAALILFVRRRSVEGERNMRRIDRIMARRHGMDGRFVRPGSLEPYDPGGYELIEFHDHVIDR